MEVSSSDLERRYSRMSDEELAGIRPDDLTPEARILYENEMNRRDREGQDGGQATAVAPAKAALKEGAKIGGAFLVTVVGGAVIALLVSFLVIVGGEMTLGTIVRLLNILAVVAFTLSFGSALSQDKSAVGKRGAYFLAFLWSMIPIVSAFGVFSRRPRIKVASTLHLAAFALLLFLYLRLISGL